MLATQTLPTLKREARKLAAARGHDLGQWSTGQVLTMADCKRCGQTAFIGPKSSSTSESFEFSGAIERDCPGDELVSKLKDALESRRIFTHTDWTGSTAYVRVYLFDRDSVDEITWEIAKLLDISVQHRGDRYGIKRAGYGYNRAQDVLSSVAHKVGVKLDQGRWTEF